MGHIRLGRLPTTRPWKKVVELLRTGADVAAIADQTARAAESEMRSAKGDPAFVYTVWLLTQLPLAARSDNYSAEMRMLGFDAGAERSLLSLVSGLSLAIDRNLAGTDSRTDLGELARQSAAETLVKVLGAGTGDLFGSTAETLQRDLARFATKDRFALLAREFFGRLTQKTLEYYLSRELPDHLGPDRRFITLDEHVAFRSALERHCREASEIVETFAGGWYAKSLFRKTLTPESARNFADYALTKMRDELRIRRSADG